MQVPEFKVGFDMIAIQRSLDRRKSVQRTEAIYMETSNGVTARSGGRIAYRHLYGQVSCFRGGTKSELERATEVQPTWVSTGRGGGGALNKVLYGDAPPRGPNPYPFIYHF